MGMTFDEWFDKQTFPIRPYHSKWEMEQAFKAGQNNCNCVHTDNSEVISNLEAQIEKMKCCNNCNNTWNGYHLNICDECFEMCNWELRK